MTLGNLSKVRVRLDIDERFIGSVFVGQPGYVVVEAYSNRKFPGKVVDIAQRMGRKNQRTDDPTERIDTKIREVVLELEDANELVPGLRATGYLSETKLEAQPAGTGKGSPRHGGQQWVPGLRLARGRGPRRPRPSEDGRIARRHRLRDHRSPPGDRGGVGSPGRRPPERGRSIARRSRRTARR